MDSTADILELAQRHGAINLAEDSIRRGESPAAFKSRLIQRLLVRELGGTFSFRRLIANMASGGASGLEAEVLQEVARSAGQSFNPNNVTIPWALFARDLTVAASSAGGYLVGSDVGEAIDVLRPWSVTARAGLTVFERLRENVALPRTTGKVTAQWNPTEATAATESTPTTGSITLSPKTASTYMELSGLFLKQTGSTGENYARRELLKTVGSLVDAAVLNGSGSAGQPTGLLNTAGIGSQSGTSLSWTGVANMKETVATANARDEGIAYIATPAVRELLEGREKFTGAGPVWNGDDVGGRRGYVTTDLPAATMVAGDWSDVILALWGPGLQVEVNPFAGFTAGIIGMRCLISCDVGIQHPGAFCAASSIT